MAAVPAADGNIAVAGGQQGVLPYVPTPRIYEQQVLLDGASFPDDGQVEAAGTNIAAGADGVEDGTAEPAAHTEAADNDCTRSVDCTGGAEVQNIAAVAVGTGNVALDDDGTDEVVEVVAVAANWVEREQAVVVAADGKPTAEAVDEQSQVVLQQHEAHSLVLVSDCDDVISTIPKWPRGRRPE